MAKIIPFRCNGACETPSEVCCNQDCDQGQECPHRGRHVPMPTFTARIVQHMGTGELIGITMMSAIVAIIAVVSFLSPFL